MESATRYGKGGLMTIRNVRNMRQSTTIKQGDLVTFKPEWSDPGDENVTFRAIENEDGGRFKVVAELDLPLNPTQVVRVEWVATVNGSAHR